MKNLVWLAGALVVVSFVFPDGFQSAGRRPVPSIVDDYTVPEAQPDAVIAKLLARADRADRSRIVGIYSSLHRVLSRDGGQRVSNTEKWSDLQAHTLQLAIEQVNKYPGLDDAIENVFKTSVGTDDVAPVRGDVLQKLLKACEIIVASAR